MKLVPASLSVFAVPGESRLTGLGLHRPEPPPIPEIDPDRQPGDGGDGPPDPPSPRPPPEGDPPSREPPERCAVAAAHRFGGVPPALRAGPARRGSPGRSAACRARCG